MKKMNPPLNSPNAAGPIKAVYRAVLKGDHEGCIYRYDVINNEVTTETTDPYAKASTLNGEDSVVADFKKLQVDFHRDALPVLNSPLRRHRL
jgi:pullulanase